MPFRNPMERPGSPVLADGSGSELAAAERLTVCVLVLVVELAPALVQRAAHLRNLIMGDNLLMRDLRGSAYL